MAAPVCTGRVDKSERHILMIPGPVEFEDNVLDAMATHAVGYTEPSFVSAAGSCIEMCRDVFLAPDAQPFIITGSGSLGWDMAASNLCERGDRVLVVSTGFFGDKFGTCCETFGLKVDILPTPLGEQPRLSEIDAALRQKRYKMITLTHVDTSSAVLLDLREIVRIVRAASPGTLVAVDGVPAVGAEELRMTEWDIDMYLTGTQKALAVPTGLSIQMLRPRAMAAWQRRSTPIPNFYGNYANWLPIMRSYEARKGAYFATPAISLFFALHAGLKNMLADGGMRARWHEHREAAAKFAADMRALGLTMVCKDEKDAATALSAVRLPACVELAPFLAAVKKHGAVIAGGIHKALKGRYFRVGHMGPSVRTQKENLDIVVKAIAAALRECGHDPAPRARL